MVRKGPPTSGILTVATCLSLSFHIFSPELKSSCLKRLTMVHLCSNAKKGLQNSILSLQNRKLDEDLSVQQL